MASAPAPHPYDPLPVGVVVIRSNLVLYANAAAAALLGVTREELVGHPLDAVARRVVEDEHLPWALGRIDAIRADARVGRDAWVRARSTDGERRGVLRVASTPSATPGEWVLTLMDADSEHATFPLAEAMVEAAGRFPRCRDEQEVYEQAVQAIFERGYWVTLMRLVGEQLEVLAMREDPEMLRRGGELYGVPAQKVRFDLSKVPHVGRSFETGRATFHNDLMVVMDKVHAPEVAQMIREVVPTTRMVDAPVFVDGKPFGIITLQGDKLTPASLPAVELYARLVAGAVENVRRQREAASHQHQLSALQKELVSRERLAAVGQAAGLLSHEARNPLGAILNALAVLRRRGAGDEGARELIDIAEEEALRLDALVRDLLELARPLEPRLRPVPLPPAVDAAIAALLRRSRAHPPVVEVRLPEGLPRVLADPTLLQVSLDNLLRNAVQAGGGAKVSLWATASASADAVTVTVKDPGPPGGRRTADEAFDPFSLEAARGTGLGLAVVKRLCDAQGGQVRAVLGGTQLEMTLPAAGYDSP